jgi:hypothetical protein
MVWWEVMAGKIVIEEKWKIQSCDKFCVRATLHLTAMRRVVIEKMHSFQIYI